MKLKTLIANLQAKGEPNTEVEFIVCEKHTGRLICMQVHARASDITKALRLFKDSSDEESSDRQPLPAAPTKDAG